MTFAQLKLIRTLMVKIYWARERWIRPNFVYILRELGCLGVPSFWCYSIFRFVVVRNALALLMRNNWFLLPCAFANKLLRTERWSCLLGVTCRTIALAERVVSPQSVCLRKLDFSIWQCLVVLCNGKQQIVVVDLMGEFVLVGGLCLCCTDEKGSSNRED